MANKSKCKNHTAKKKKKSYCQDCKPNQTNLQTRCDLQGCHFANCAWHHWFSNFRVQNHLGSLSVQIPRAHTWESKRILIQLVHGSSRIYSFFLITRFSGGLQASGPKTTFQQTCMKGNLGESREWKKKKETIFLIHLKDLKYSYLLSQGNTTQYHICFNFKQ